MAGKDSSLPLCWIDLEVLEPFGGLHECLLTLLVQQMTGLDTDNDVIIEIFCIITNGDLELLDEEGWGTVVHASREKMDAMGEYVTEMHRKTGLTEKVVASTVTPQQAADGLLEYIQKYIPERKTGLLAGNSVHADRGFLRKEPYKKITQHLHHRILDVSSIKEAARRWSSPEIVRRVPSKKMLHIAKDDILESIEEAKYYRHAIFQGAGK